MQIVINIPEKYKKLLDSGEADGSVRKSILSAVVNGTPTTVNVCSRCMRSGKVTRAN